MMTMMTGMQRKMVQTAAMMMGCAMLLVSAAAGTEPAHLADARRLVSQIQQAQAAGQLVDANNVEINRYGASWGSSFVRFADAQNGVLPGQYAQCSSLVSRMLQYSYGWTWSAYSFIDPITGTQASSVSPASYRYQALIEQQQGFGPAIQQLTNVLPGDIITMVDVGTTSGHTGIVNAVRLNSALPYPSELAGANPALAGTWYIELDILDCSSGVHTNDTRVFQLNGQTVTTSGVGIGTMGILVDSQYRVVGHTWSLPTSSYYTKKTGWLNGLHSRLKLQSERAVTFGRLTLN